MIFFRNKQNYIEYKCTYPAIIIFLGGSWSPQDKDWGASDTSRSLLHRGTLSVITILLFGYCPLIHDRESHKNVCGSVAAAVEGRLKLRDSETVLYALLAAGGDT